MSAQCAICVVNLRTGDIEHRLEIGGIVEEIYDVNLLPNVIRPMPRGFRNAEKPSRKEGGGSGEQATFVELSRTNACTVRQYGVRDGLAKQEATMLGFHDTTRAIDERNEARMNFRTKPRIKTAIQQAAALSGVDDSVFTMNAAYRAALATIAAHERTVLQPVDHEAFFAALDTPAAPTDALRLAFRRHGKTVVSQ